MHVLACVYVFTCCCAYTPNTASCSAVGQGSMWGVQEGKEETATDSAFAAREAVLADAAGLLTCYGVGEDSSAALPHAVVELCFTSSVRFLQPGLLLQVSMIALGAQQRFRV